MFKIEYAPQALEDLQRLRKYVLENFGEDLSKKILIKVTSDIRKLERFPLLGIDMGKIIDVPTDYRLLISEKNYIFYHLQSNKVRVVRILNEKQDYIQQLLVCNSTSADD
ncbi:type II toxin-antitoxin system RelE/ParE family toxin [Haloplasma contractile]|uniref:RelE-StbE family addiction module toxin protein n=1 Tax=Haloplasma contractile SSD-17B TaxID=1033810 RepID=U2E887_9MOLU|nr:type II toxin-antitoxin system RelE/ParE family toxin [Haloplasma contractile]ERJ11403.1 RelE-StbE family addiction module toxin protein [Haloplasma contractile SSD-17B]